MSRDKVSLKPPPQKIKHMVAALSLFSLGRSFQAAAALDPDLKNEIEAWPEGFTVVMKVMPAGPAMVVSKSRGKLIYRGGRPQNGDLTVMFKNLESALRVLTAVMGTHIAFAQHRITVQGDLALAMSLTRCLNIVQAYLFPRFICRRIMKRVPGIPLARRLKNRGIIYTTGLLLGKP